MKPTLLLALLALGLPCAAQAQDSDSETVPITGTVSRLCVLGPPSQTSVDLGQLVDVSGARVGRLTTIANRTVNLPGSFCNFAGSAVTVSASALVAANTAPIQTGFARAVNYTATASGWGVAPTAAATAATGAGTSPTVTQVGATQGAPRLADIALALSSFGVPGDSLLVAGAYAGQVIITLSPASVGD